MVPTQLKLGCLAICLLPIAAFVIYGAVTVTPVTWATERLAAKRTIEVCVLDAESGQPIDNAVVVVDADYRWYRTGLMGYRTKTGHRAYRLRTNGEGIASIPLKYFLIRGLQFDRVLLWFSKMRSADLPERYLIAALRDDYSREQVRIEKVGDDFPFSDPNLRPELKLTPARDVPARDATKFCFVHGLTRDFDPTQKPDHRHWRKPPEPKYVDRSFSLKFVPFKGFVPVDSE